MAYSHSIYPAMEAEQTKTTAEDIVIDPLLNEGSQ